VATTSSSPPQAAEPGAPRGHAAARMPEGAARLDRQVTLLDGATVRMRAIRPDDMDRLRAFHSRLSAETVLFRYFSYVPVLSQERAYHLTHLDYENRMALVATIGSGTGERIVGVVSYERLSPTSAEVAFVVEDGWQGRGIATQLFYPLAVYARGRGITIFVAEIMSDNRRMLGMLRNTGYPISAHVEGGTIEMRLDISAPPIAPVAPCVDAGSGAPAAGAESAVPGPAGSRRAQPHEA
jgi:RimJ/RimL family protein N-acetyltransferase